MSTRKEFVFTSSGPKKIEVKYTLQEGAGAGAILCKGFCDILGREYPNRVFEHCLDWASGPGFIGFELLDNNFCSNLSLLDSYGAFISSAKRSIKQAGLSNVNTFVCDHISALGPDKKFDLIVGNPPWANQFEMKDVDVLRIVQDIDWKMHREFYANIKRYLLPDAVILLAAGNLYSNPEVFRPFIEDGGLYIHKVHNLEEYGRVYWLEIKSK